MNIGKSLKHYMNQQDKKRGDLAQYLGFEYTYISTLCNDKKKGLKHVPDFAEFFGVTASEFIKAGE